MVVAEVRLWNCERDKSFEKLTDLTPYSSFQTVTAPYLVENIPVFFLEHKCPSTFPQNPTTSPHPQSHKLVPCLPHSFLKIHFNIIPHLILCIQNGLFSPGFPVKKPHAFLSSPCVPNVPPISFSFNLTTHGQRYK